MGLQDLVAFIWTRIVSVVWFSKVLHAFLEKQENKSFEFDDKKEKNLWSVDFIRSSFDLIFFMCECEENILTFSLVSWKAE